MKGLTWVSNGLDWRDENNLDYVTPRTDFTYSGEVIAQTHQEAWDDYKEWARQFLIGPPKGGIDGMVGYYKENEHE